MKTTKKNSEDNNPESVDMEAGIRSVDEVLAETELPPMFGQIDFHVALGFSPPTPPPTPISTLSPATVSLSVTFETPVSKIVESKKQDPRGQGPPGVELKNPGLLNSGTESTIAAPDGSEPNTLQLKPMPECSKPPTAKPPPQ